MAGRELCIPIPTKSGTGRALGQSETINLIRSTGRGVGFVDYLWNLGQVVKVGFIRGNDVQHELVKQGFKIYEETGINLKFAFIPNYLEADIRVSFLRGDGEGSWSVIGTNTRTVSSRQPTMNISLDTLANALHEIWHSLGGGHEHGSPNSKIPFDKAAVERIFKAKYGWSAAQIESQLYRVYNNENLILTEYDRDSISQYPISNDLTIGDFEIKLNKTLSKLDIVTLLMMYPPDTAQPIAATDSAPPIIVPMSATIQEPIPEKTIKIINPKPNYKTAYTFAGLAAAIYLGTR